VLDAQGRRLGPTRRAPTPKPATVSRVLGVVKALAARAGRFDRVAVGFPGALVAGRVATAPNLDAGSWRGLHVPSVLERALERPARVSNDAVVHGLGVSRAVGVELILTLGTGVGSALFVDGRAVPLEVGHLPALGGRSYEARLGERARRRVGTARWRRLVARAVRDLRAAFLPDVLYLGGGNAARLADRPPARARVVANDAGLLGAFRLWSGGAPRLTSRRPRRRRGGPPPRRRASP
jgi:polyphosphate glucokinase